LHREQKLPQLQTSHSLQSQSSLSENAHLKAQGSSQQLQRYLQRLAQRLLTFHVAQANAVHLKLVRSEQFFLVDVQ
jgi:hypothetical protein